MALNANCVANVTTSGSDDNAGWFDTTSGDTAGGVNDRAFSNSPIIIDGVTITASVHSTTTQANIVGHTLATTDRGNVLRISGGTATAGYYRITSVDTANNRVTVDASMGAASATITGRIGGAFASPALATASAGTARKINIKAGTYNISVNSSNVSNGWPHFNGTYWRVSGYSSTYNDGGLATLIATSAVSQVVKCDGSSGSFFTNLIFDSNSNATFAFEGGGSPLNTVYKCEIIGRTGSISGSVLSRCKIAGGIDHNCYLAYQCLFTGGGRMVGASHQCINIGNGTNHGFGATGTHFGSIAYNCAVGFDTDTNTGPKCQDCIAVNCVRGFYHSSADSFGSILIRCAGFNNSVGTFLSGNGINIEAITLTADPFVDAANGNFALNNTSGGGATLRALNFQLPSISTTRYPFGGWYAPGGGCPLIGPGGLVY